MFDLRMFPKIGVRVPMSLKRRVRQLALDVEAEGFAIQGGEMTMEAIFSVATLALLAMDPAARAEAFRTHLPELLAAFERESPPPSPDGDGDAKKPAGVAGEEVVVNLPDPKKRSVSPKSAGRRRREGNGSA